MPKHAISAGVALAFCATPVLADLTAPQVWADWQRGYGALGSTVSAASETYEDGTLTLTDIVATATLGEVDTISTYSGLTLVEQPDGSVRIEIPARLDITSATTVMNTEQTQTLALETTGWDAVVREDGAGRVYDISAATLAYVFDGMTGGSGNEGEDVTGRMTLSNMATTYTNVASGDVLATDQTLSADGAVITAASPDAGFEMTYTLDAIASVFAGTIDLAATPVTPTLSSMGLLLSGDATHEGSTLAVTAASDSGPVSINGTSGGGRIGIDISEDTLGYTLGSTDAQMTLTLSAFPVPLNLTMSELSTGLALPLGVSDEPKPYALSLAWRDVAIDDAIWGMFDPTGQLPRDPATILLNVSGTALMKADIFGGDPAAMAAMNGAPGELRTLDLTQLNIALAGAMLQGNGMLEFPTPGPVPQPVGTLNLSLDGGLALADKLVALGFLPAEQVAFAKGMAGVVARPVGEDQLESEIVFTPDGGITANGLPLQ
ncbi:hypothetical protein [Jannaschia sp. 2305UL9-9]|uniref:hypothetical protein n=1 Tax=Jannaschia sp. 2305UL9-9 TaxID=3121638 RepID=UPI003528F848